jgi:Fungal trichothecene efflux pump (TRI12)
VTLLTLFVLACGGAGFYSLAAFWSLEIQFLFGPDPLTIAKLTVPFGFAFLLGIFIFSWSIDLLHGENRLMMLIASCTMTAGIGTMVLINQDTPGLSSGLSFLGGLGVGGVYIPAIVCLTVVAPDEVIGTIVAVGLAIRLIGGQIGYTVYFSLFNMTLQKIPENISVEVVQAGLPVSEVQPFIIALMAKNSTALFGLQGITPYIIKTAQEVILGTYLRGFNLVYVASIGFGGAAIVACVFLGNIRKYMTSRVAVEV